MDLVELLETRRAEILMDAGISQSRSHLVQYDPAERQERQQRLRTLYNLVLRGVRVRDMEALRDYMETIAQEQYAAGSDLYEAQMALNVLEEAIWHHIVVRMPACAYSESIGLITTVLSAAKDTLAQAYIARACKTDTLPPNRLELLETADHV